MWLRRHQCIERSHHEFFKLVAPCFVSLCALLRFQTISFWKLFSPKNLIEHHLDVMAGVPIAVIVKAAGLIENPRQLDASGAHKFDVGLRGFMAVVKGAFLLRLAPEDLVIPIGVEGRINVDEVDAGVGQLLELLKIVAAVDDARVEKR